VTAIDNDPEMIAVARRKASEACVPNIDWVVGRAEDLAIAPATCDLITAGSAFHWMDRELLSQRAHAGLKDGAAFALIGGGSSVWEQNAEWHSIAVGCLRTYLGEPRRAGSRTYGVTKKHQDFLTPAGFSVESRDYPTEHSWTADAIIGYLYSTSFAGSQVLGDRREPFERDLRDALARAQPDGVFHEELDFYVIVAHKP
jgi:SAM-dependent methyltransferase